MYKIVERSEESQMRDKMNKKDKVNIFKGKKFIQSCDRAKAHDVVQSLVENDNWNAMNRD